MKFCCILKKKKKIWEQANLVDGANKKGGVVRLMQDPDLK
jgi:hypothetical protein